MKYKTLTVLASSFSLACQVSAASDFKAIQKRLGIPTSIATVVDASGKNPQMILIQDVHRHPEAQGQIAAMILYGLGHWGTKEIFVEGSWSEDGAYKGSAKKYSSLTEAVRAGRVGGAEMAAALSPNQDFRFLGLEDPQIYKENVAAYEAVQNVKSEALRELETARLFGRIADADANPRWDQIQRLIQLHLKPGEYAEYVKSPYRPNSNSALANAVVSAELFYELANRRSEVFLAKATRLHRSGTQLLVVGGFHTTEMSRLLRAKGVSYAVLSPRITQGGFEDLYTNGMHEPVSALKLH